MAFSFPLTLKVWRWGNYTPGVFPPTSTANVTCPCHLGYTRFANLSEGEPLGDIAGPAIYVPIGTDVRPSATQPDLFWIVETAKIFYQLDLFQDVERGLSRERRRCLCTIVGDLGPPYP